MIANNTRDKINEKQRTINYMSRNVYCTVVIPCIVKPRNKGPHCFAVVRTGSIPFHFAVPFSARTVMMSTSFPKMGMNTF